jgi:hypothetical protein
VTVEDVVEALAREPLRHIVLLKQLLAYPEHVTVHRVSGAVGVATSIALDTSVSAYDRLAYPKASIAAFIASDHPELTSLLMPHVPRGVGIVFKLASEADWRPSRPTSRSRGGRRSCRSRRRVRRLRAGASW